LLTLAVHGKYNTHITAEYEMAQY